MASFPVSLMSTERDRNLHERDEIDQMFYGQNTRNHLTARFPGSQMQSQTIEVCWSCWPFVGMWDSCTVVAPRTANCSFGVSLKWLSEFPSWVWSEGPECLDEESKFNFPLCCVVWCCSGLRNRTESSKDIIECNFLEEIFHLSWKEAVLRQGSYREDVQLGHQSVIFLLKKPKKPDRSVPHKETVIFWLITAIKLSNRVLFWSVSWDMNRKIFAEEDDDLIIF